MSRWNDRLLANAGALMLSSVATGVLGLVYWIIAGRLLPAEEVGRASAIISTATMLSSLSCLSLGGAYQRFLPVAGRRTYALIGGGFLLSGGVAVILGLVFAQLPVADRILHSGTDRWVFPVLVLVFTLFALTDPILTGLRRAPAVAAKNISLSVAKIPPLLFIGVSGAAMGIVLSWAAFSLILAVFFMLLALQIAARSRDRPGDGLPPPRELLGFQGVFFTMMLVASLTPLALPLIVVSQAGTSANAHFNLAWTMCSAAGLLRGAACSAFIVEAASVGADRSALMRRFGRMLTVITAVTALGLAIGGPVVLYAAGPDYFAAAWPLMLVMAAETVVETVVTLYFTVAQLLRRLRLMLITQIVMVTITVAGAFLLIGPLGLVGAGVAELIAATVALVLVAGPLIRGIRDFLTPTPEADQALQRA